MKKLRIAIIGQGRSGRNIHGRFMKDEANIWFDVVAVVDAIEERRNRAKEEYPGCEVFADYKELFGRTDIDLVTNATYSDDHYSVTKDLLQHGFNVVVEKPFARSYYECNDLINTATENTVTLAVFQHTFFALHYLKAVEVIHSGIIGEVKQASIRYNGLSRRWDWQTLQHRVAGSLYNTGPHPVGMALGFLDLSDDARVEYTKLGSTGLTAGDADDYAKLILTAPGKPVVDLEISALDAFNDYNVKLQGTLGTYKANTVKYEMKYIVPGENPERKPVADAISDEEGMPTFCKEELITHTEEGTFTGSAFNEAVRAFYEMMYKKLTDGTPLTVTPEMAAKIIQVIETAHAENPLPKQF